MKVSLQGRGFPVWARSDPPHPKPKWYGVFSNMLYFHLLWRQPSTVIIAYFCAYLGTLDKLGKRIFLILYIGILSDSLWLIRGIFSGYMGNFILTISVNMHRYMYGMPFEVLDNNFFWFFSDIFGFILAFCILVY